MTAGLSIQEKEAIRAALRRVWLAWAKSEGRDAKADEELQRSLQRLDDVLTSVFDHHYGADG